MIKIILIIFSVIDIFSYSFSQETGLEFSKTKNDFSFDYSLILNANKYKFKTSFGVTRILADPYNDNKINRSAISILNGGAMICVVVSSSLIFSKIIRNDSNKFIN
jgi:hypothetical protein